jgi:mono/diheme cytochrome c family protein
MRKYPLHLPVYICLFLGIVGALTFTISNSIVYPMQLWFIDMVDAEMVKAYEEPMRDLPEGTVSRNHYRPHSEEYGTSLLRTTPLADELSNPYTVDSDVLANGEWGFTVYCAPCHGTSGEGNGPVTQNKPSEGQHRFQMPGVPLVGAAGVAKARSDGYLYLTIRNGGVIMPSYGLQLSDEEIWSVVSYVRELDKKG